LPVLLYILPDKFILDPSQANHHGVSRHPAEWHPYLMSNLVQNQNTRTAPTGYYTLFL
jgi:hypothetical protein